MVDTKGIGVVAIMLFLGIFGVFIGGYQVYQHNLAVQEYEPTTDVTIVETDIKVIETDDDTKYEPITVYEYEVDGEVYEEDNTYPGRFTRNHGSRSTARSVINLYEEGSGMKTDGSEITVYYNPQDPSQAYLRNDGWPGSWFIGAGYAIAAFLAGGYLIRKGFRRWRQRQLIQNTPTETAQSLSIGPSEVKGSATTAERQAFRAPFSQDDCVVAKYEIKEYDTSGDNSSWKTIEEDILHQPFYVDDGTGTVKVQPHDEAYFDLDPDDWTEEYVDSSDSGPEPVRRFVEQHHDVDYPSDQSGKGNDRKYRQNLIRKNESVYVFGTVQQRDRVPKGADNADRLEIKKVTDNTMREPMFLISDDETKDLINRRRFALWRLPVGGFFLFIGFAIVMFMFAPMLGLEVPFLL